MHFPTSCNNLQPQNLSILYYNNLFVSFLYKLFTKTKQQNPQCIYNQCQYYIAFHQHFGSDVDLRSLPLTYRAGVAPCYLLGAVWRYAAVQRRNKC